MNAELTIHDFAIGDVVQHIFYGRYATVAKVGRKYLTCRLHPSGIVGYRWLPTSVRRADGPPISASGTAPSGA